MKKNRINIALSLTAIVLTVGNIAVLLYGAALSNPNGQSNANGSPWMYLSYSIIGTVGTVFLLLFLYRIIRVVNKNIDETVGEFKSEGAQYDFIESELRALRIPYWAFLVLAVADLISDLLVKLSYIQFPLTLLVLIFMGVYLQQVFSSLQSLYTVKNDIYDRLRNEREKAPVSKLRPIKRRNPFLAIVFMIVTLGIYEAYLWIKLSREINRFVETDEADRREIFA